MTSGARISYRIAALVLVLLAALGGAKISREVAGGAGPPIGALVAGFPCFLAVIAAGVLWTKSNRG
jgi:hypothetical protein